MGKRYQAPRHRAGRGAGLAATDERWTRAEAAALRRLTTPARIQDFLDGIPYSTDSFYRCPRRVLGERKAHCYDGALLAAAALRRLGFPPLLVDLRAVRDDDHVLAVFRRGRFFGAVAKSNFVGLRFRDPIYRSLRELALSYFPYYYNLEGEKSLRAFSRLFDLRPFDGDGWMFRDQPLERIATRLDEIRHFPLLARQGSATLAPVDKRSYRAGMLGADPAGLYHPPAGR
jgi:hypothetical protein